MGSEEQIAKRESRPGDLIAKFAALTSLLLLLICTCAIIFSSNPKSLGWFTYHPPLQILAIALITYGILTLQPTSHPSTKAAGLDRHQYTILFLGLPVLSLGTFSIIYKKWPYPHGYALTWHGTVGYMSILWIFLQIAGGGGSIWFGGAAFGGGANAKRLQKYHRLSGYVLLPLLLATVHLGGTWSRWAITHTSNATRLIVYTIAPAVVLISVYARARSVKMQFWPPIFKRSV
jgi:hypothetical protein